MRKNRRTITAQVANKRLKYMSHSKGSLTTDC